MDSARDTARNNAEKLKRGQRPMAGWLAGCVLLFAACAAVRAQSVSLVWDASPSANVAGYTVRYGTNSGQYLYSAPAQTATTATVANLTAGVTYYFVVTAYSTNFVESDPSNEFPYLVPGGPVTNAAPGLPTLSQPANVVINEDAGEQAVALRGISSGLASSAAGLSVTAASSNLALVTGLTVNYTSPATNGTLWFTPAPDAFGTASITVTVNNFQAASNLTARTFTVTINPVNDAPTLNDLADVSLNINAGRQTVSLAGISSGAANENQSLSVSAVSSNPGLVPNPAVSYTGGASGSLSFTPAPGASGTATISVSVNDGQAQNGVITRSFDVTIGSSPVETIFIEAESGIRVSPMILGTNTNASGGQYVYTRSAEVGTVTFPFTTTQAGDYVVWCRILSSNNNSDSFYFSYDGEVEDTYVTITPPNTWSGAWQWSQLNGVNEGYPRILTLNRGAHQLVFRGRETSTFLDALYITNDRDFTPPATPAPNRPPTLNAISNQAINEDAGPGTVGLSGITSGATNENQTLTVTAVSNNPLLIPNPVVNYTNLSTTGVLTFAPTTNASGSAIITVSVNDGQTTSNLFFRYFVITVNPVNDAPTLDPLADLTLNAGAGLQVVSLSGISQGATNENQSLLVSAVSSNPGLIPNPAVAYTNGNATGRLTFTPAAGMSGTAAITVTVNDGQSQNATVSRTFAVTVGSSAANPLFLEAESGTLAGPMITASNAAASSGRYVYSQSADAGTVTFRLDIPQTGDYVIWCRVLSTDAARDSFYVALDGGAEQIYRTVPETYSSQWQWSRVTDGNNAEVRIFNLARGAHTLRFRAREAFTLLDTLFATADLSFVPPPNFVPQRLTISPVTTPSPGMRISFQAAAGSRYEVQATEDFRSWTTFWTSPVAATNQLLSIVDTTRSGSGKRFYRTRLIDPSTASSPALRLALTPVSGPARGMQISFQPAAGSQYEIQATEDFLSWTTIWVSPLAFSTQPISFLDTAPTASGRRFYRVRPFDAVAASSTPPRLAMTPVSNGGMQLTLQPIPGLQYEIQATEDFVSWTSLWISPVAASSDSFHFVDNVRTPSGKRFYRARRIDATASGVGQMRLDVARVASPIRGTQVSFSAASGFRYAIQATEDFQSWTTIWSSPLTTVSRSFSVVDTAQTASRKRFYRVEITN